MIPARLFPFALLLLPGVAAAQDNACPQFFPTGTPPAFANPKLAQGAVLLCNDGFAVSTSAVTRGALWSAERLTRASVEAARRTPRENRFHPDARLPPEGRAGWPTTPAAASTVVTWRPAAICRPTRRRSKASRWPTWSRRRPL